MRTKACSKGHRDFGGGRVETRPPSQAGVGSNFDNRIKLDAALANTTSQSTLSSPRSLTLRSQPIVFNQPNAGSMRGRACCLLA
jgi:hypothetical protein